MFFTVGKIQKQLKEIKASIHRERRDIQQFKYVESDCHGAQEPEFDDRAWESGPSGFGYGDGDDATVLEDLRGSATTIYIRHRFPVEDPARLPAVSLSIAADDGCVAYLNGVEVGRVRAGEAGAPLPAAGTADREAPEPLAAYIDLLRHAPARWFLAMRPLLARLDLDTVVRSARFPGTEMIPAPHAVRAALVLKLLGTARRSHVMDLLFDEGVALAVGLNAVPKATFMSQYSSRLGRRVARCDRPTIGAERRCSGHADDRSSAHRARDANPRFEGASARYQLPHVTSP